jgi:DNA processing protein
VTESIAHSVAHSGLEHHASIRPSLHREGNQPSQTLGRQGPGTSLADNARKRETGTTVMSNDRWTPEDLLWPFNEAESKHAPSELFVAGDHDLLRAGPTVSIVGSRKASREGLARADKLARLLVAHGVIVVSGLAEGIDTAAHRAAIDNGGKTIAVLGTPLDQTYPAKNRALQQEIMRDHLAVSQFASGTKVGRHTFPMRNKTMALISDATVIIEASDGSGTLHQGWEAIRLARPLYLTKSLLDNVALEFPRKFADYGAEVLTEDSLADLIRQLPNGRREVPDEIPF